MDATAGSPIAGRQAWTTGSPTAAVDDMTQVVVDLGGFVPAGETSVPALARWRLVTDPVAPGALPGLAWWIDDITITENDPNCVVATPTPSPSPTPSPEPTSTGTPVVTPTPTPVVTPTPTPSGQPAQGQAILLLNTWKNGALDVGASVHVLARHIIVDSASRSAAKTSGEGSVVVDSPYLTKVVGLTTGSGFSP